MIDYGYSRSDYYSPLRTEGTLTSYRNQQRQKSIFEGIGENDITAHVDFTAIAEAGLEAGCQLLGFTDQHHFMVGAAESRLLAFEKEVAAGYVNPARAAFLGPYRSLMHPGTMGMAFKFLLLPKGLIRAPKLTGFKYASDPWRSL